jgi:hypothetical protein
MNNKTVYNKELAISDFNHAWQDQDFDKMPGNTPGNIDFDYA